GRQAGGDGRAAGGRAGSVRPGASPGDDAVRGRPDARSLSRDGKAAVDSRPAAPDGETGRPSPGRGTAWLRLAAGKKGWIRRAPGARHGGVEGPSRGRRNAGGGGGCRKL